MLPGASVNPTARRWELASRLRALRVAAGKSIEDAAHELMCSAAKISRMETAGRGVQPRDVRDLCRLYGVSDAVRDDLMQAAIDARKSGWWQNYNTLDEQVTTIVGLESEADGVWIFEGMRIPGLLQRPEYSKILIEKLRPPAELTAEWIEGNVALRVRRQARVASGELSLHAIIDEAALRRPVGSPEIMLAQIENLITEAERPNVTLQVIPFGHGPHPGMEGSFYWLTFPRGIIDDVVFVEGLLGSFLLDKDTRIAEYKTVYDDLSNRVALSPESTIVWLKALTAEHRSAAGATKRRTRSG